MTGFRAVSLTILAMLAMLGMLVAGCGGRIDPAAPEEYDAPIIGGERDPGDPSVVAVYGEGEQGGFLCTGSVIAPTVVLTAAHCVAASETGAGARFVVLTGTDLQQGGGGALAVREVHANPRWNPEDLAGGHDQGVVLLSRPTALRPLPLNRQSLPGSAVGRQVRLVGYGATSGRTQAGAGLKRQAVTRLQAISRNLLEIGTSRRGTCNGDSGGPAFLDIGGSEILIGTTSFGNATCTDGGTDARVDTDLDFLDRYLQGRCTPSCDGRSCGGDGCGGACGACGAGEICSAAGVCGSPTGGCGSGGREAEPNDSALQANALCAGGTIAGTLATADDEDWFTWSVAADSVYDVRLAGAPAGADVRVYKSSPEGRLSYIGEGLEISRHTDAGGTYVGRVTGGSGSSATYTLTVRTTP